VQIHIALTGPPRVILGRSAVDLDLHGAVCTLEDLLAALADAEPRIARYFQGENGQPPASLRPLLNDHLLEPGTPIPDGATVTFLYTMAGGTSKEPMGSGTATRRPCTLATGFEASLVLRDRRDT
jgi:molybdopterin converting factor small subunit